MEKWLDVGHFEGFLVDVATLGPHLEEPINLKRLEHPLELNLKPRDTEHWAQPAQDASEPIPEGNWEQLPDNWENRKELENWLTSSKAQRRPSIL